MYSLTSSSFIGKGNFRLGGVAPSEWTRSDRALRDTQVAHSSVPGVNTTRRIAYCHPVPVSLFLHTLAVTDFKPTLGRCGQLWQYIWMSWLGTRLHWDRNAMGDAATSSHSIPSTSAQYAILTLLIIDIVQSRQIHVAIDNPLLVPSVSCLTTSRYLCDSVRTADNVSHAENLQSYSCRCFSHLYEFRDGIQVTWAFRYCGQCQHYPVLNKSCILIKNLDSELWLQLRWQTPIQCAITPRQEFLHSHRVILSVSATPALDSFSSIHLRYAFTFETLNLNLDTMVNTELNCVQLFFRYIRLVTTLKLDKLHCAVVYYHALHCILCIVK